MNIEDLDPKTLAYVASLKREAIKYRLQRNGLRAENTQLREELAALRAGSDVTV
jgi:hypothetical protein